MGIRVDRIVKGTLRGNLNPGNPSRGPRDLAKAHQRVIEREEAKLASVAAALDVAAAPSKEPDEIVAPSPPQVEPQVAFDPAKPFAEVRGEPGIGYVQGENYFARDKAFVKKAPEHAWYFPEVVAPKAKEDALRAARSEFRKLPDVPRAPRSVIDAERENAKAAAAEAFAE
jgi:hypothetical protein